MLNASIAATSDLGDLCVRLRDDVRFRHQTLGDATCFVIEDPLTGGYYRIGVAEYALISLLDGKTPLREAIARTAVALGRQSFTEAEGATICRWLIDTQLVKSDGPAPGRDNQDAVRDDRLSLLRHNPLMFRVPLGRPNRWVARWQPLLAWMVDGRGLVLWMLVLATSLFQSASHAADVWAGMGNACLPHRWLGLILAWLVIKAVHELFHGLVCQKYGGEVRQFGVNFLLFLPMPYVDVSAAWRFPSKWMRIHTALAGMYAELFLAAVACLLWLHTAPGLPHTLAFDVMLLASVTTILFNANPLMRFDGYYALSEWLEIQNLNTLGASYVGNLGKRYLLGMPVSWTISSWKRSFLIKSYGLLAFVWRAFASLTILIAATKLFHGAGTLLALASIVIWWVVPWLNRLRLFLDSQRPSAIRWWRVVSALAVLSLLLVSLVTWIPAPASYRSPGVVVYEPLAVVRLRIGGWLDELHVASGQEVAADQVLAVLHNPELATELAEVRLAHEESQTRLSFFRAQHDVVSLQQEDQKQRSLALRLRQLQDDVKSLVVVAPTAGQVVTPDVAWKMGAYLPAGSELLSIGHEQCKQVIVSVSQKKAVEFREAVGSSVLVLVNDGSNSTRVATLASVESGATRNIRELALATPGGGPLVATPRPDSPPKPQSPSDAWEFLEPRFTAITSLSRDDARDLRAGQRTRVCLPTSRETMGNFLWDILKDSLLEPDR